MDDDDIARLIGLGLGVAALAAAANYVAPRWDGWVASGTARGTHLWHELRWWALAFLALFVAYRVASWWLDRRAKQREETTARMAAKLARLMPASWKPEEHLRIRKWDGMSPSRLQIRLVPGCDDESTEWRRELIKATGIAARPDWDRAIRKGWLDVRAEATVAAQDEASEGIATDAMEGALTGLVPGVQVERAGESVTIRYAETTRDQSPQWRQRVVDQVSARTGTRWRATWNRQARAVTLTSVPALPDALPFSATFASIETGNPRIVPYGLDENGDATCWFISPKGGQPHAICVGETGTGKTETMKSIINGFLLMGGLVAIADPKRVDFAEYLGRPGVVCVATDIEDRVGLLTDVMAEVHRRNAAGAAAKLIEDHPELADQMPSGSLERVPFLLVVDELTQHNADLAAWWASLSGEERAAWGGNPKSGKPTELSGIPGQIAQLARFSDVHLLVGMQRGDASNFGDSTQMRDNLPHIITMGQTSAISSEMVWGDRSTGRDVEIQGQGEGMSNGLRVRGGHTIRPAGTPGRFKSMYVADEARGSAFWESVAPIAPAADLIDLPHVSDRARDPQAALANLLQFAGRTSQSATPEAVIPAVSPAPAPAEAPGVETDGAGHEWERVNPTDLEAGDVISFGDVASVDVVEVEGWVADDFTGDEVFRLVLLQDGQETCVDLSGDEVVERRMD